MAGSEALAFLSVQMASTALSTTKMACWLKTGLQEDRGALAMTSSAVLAPRKSGPFVAAPYLAEMPDKPAKGRTRDISSQLTVWRLRARLSKRKLARQLDVPVAQITAWESSSDDSLTLRTLRQCAKVTCTSVSVVCDGTVTTL
jgi:hypothetical protein